ncbi:MAG: hypothetical protein AUJ49_03655 [Desulfovibrionaceae bacterium CG1_02_65_16]|nr:MAG: hypothetical protein AUJ49_03655 [Desulfovibrionaceae bacterium CG1_02_65_16]
MRRPVLNAVLLAAAALLLFGCGYTFTGMGSEADHNAADRLAPEMRSMHILRVENPSTEAWLEPRLRSLVRDEFNRRHLVTWTDKAHATSLLTIVIKRYSRSTYISGRQDQSMKLSTSITMTFRVTRASDGMVIYDSGEQSKSESYYPGDADGADMRLTDLAVRRMTSLMTENY